MTTEQIFRQKMSSDIHYNKTLGIQQLEILINVDLIKSIRSITKGNKTCLS